MNGSSKHGFGVIITAESRWLLERSGMEDYSWKASSPLTFRTCLAVACS